MKTKKQEELVADIRYFWSEFRTRDDAEDGSSLRKGSKQYKQPCDDIFMKVSAVLEPTPWVAKFWIKESARTTWKLIPTCRAAKKQHHCAPLVLT